MNGVDLNTVNTGVSQLLRSLTESFDHLVDLFDGHGTGLDILGPAVRGSGSGSAGVLNVNDGGSELVEEVVLCENGHPAVDSHGTAEACCQLNEQLAAGLVVLFHVGLELLEHLVVLPQPLAAGDTEGIAHTLHTGEDKADAVLCSVEQEVSGFLIEVVGLQPAEQGGAAHGALNDAVLDLYVTDLPRGKESAVFFVHEIHPFLFLSYFFTEMGNRKACPSTVFYKPLCRG